MMAILKQVFIITDRKRAEKIEKEVRVAGGHFSQAMLGRGTARSDLLEVLGLDSSEKVLLTATAAPSSINGIMYALVQDFDFGKGGGVAFTVPLSSVSGKAALMILSGGKLK